MTALCTQNLAYTNMSTKPFYLHKNQCTHIQNLLNPVLFSSWDFPSRSHQCFLLFLHFKPILQSCFWHSTGLSTCTYRFFFPTHIKCNFCITLMPVAFASFCWGFFCSLAYCFWRKNQRIFNMQSWHFSFKKFILSKII